MFASGSNLHLSPLFLSQACCGCVRRTGNCISCIFLGEPVTTWFCKQFHGAFPCYIGTIRDLPHPQIMPEAHRTLNDVVAVLGASRTVSHDLHRRTKQSLQHAFSKYDGDTVLEHRNTPALAHDATIKSATETPAFSRSRIMATC